MPKLICFFDKTCLSPLVAVASIMAVLVLIWMLYLLTSVGL